MKYLLVAIGIFIAAAATAQVQKSDSIRTTQGDEVVVTAERTYSAASDGEFQAKDFSLRPRSSTQDMLRIVPGLYIAQHAGGGKAEQIFLRGFDCDHGTDVNISVDDAPVNMLSHGHGQGYADLHFIIPETIQRVDVAKGPYFARYGDLATAGTVVFNTYDSLNENLFRIETGSYEYSPEISRGLASYRVLALIKSPFESETFHAYVGGEYFTNSGYFDLDQHFKRYNLMAKASALLGDEATLTGSIFSFSSNWDANGQIPERAITEGLISRFGSIDSTEGGETARTTAILKYSTGGAAPFTISSSFTHYHFKLFSDFTFFASDTNRGDEIEQTDDRSILTLKAEKTLSWFGGETGFINHIGAQLRGDNIDVGLFHDSARSILSTTTNGSITERQYGLYDEQEIVLPFMNIQAGLRADYITFDVKSALATASTPNGSVQQFVLSPKLNVAVPVSDRLTFFGNSGYGFHSNDARAVVSSPNSPSLPRALGLEVGSRIGKTSDLIYGSIALWQLDLQSELVWSGDEGTTEESGRTRRQGVDLDVRLNAFEWLTLGADLTLSHGRFRDLPAGANYIPLAPNRTLTANATARFGEFSTALRLRSLDDRAANEDNSVTAKGYSVFDLSASYRFSNFELSATIENLFNVSWNEAQFDTDSRLRGEPLNEPSDLHFTAGSPRSYKIGIAYRY